MNSFRYAVSCASLKSRWTCWPDKVRARWRRCAAAGAADFHKLAPAFWKVLNVDARDANGGQIAFAWTAADVVEALVAETPGTYMAIYMAPEGVIFGGDRAGVRQIADKLRERQIYVQPLPYPPIHTPALSPARIELRHCWRRSKRSSASRRSISIRASRPRNTPTTSDRYSTCC